MIRLWRCLFFVALFFFAAYSTKEQDCPGCDCRHIPITPPSCYKCCRYDIGKIESVTASKLVLSQGTKGEQKEFRLDEGTARNAELRPNTTATVYHPKDGNTATRVDSVAALKNLLRPGNEPDPPIRPGCSVPPNDLKVFMGNSIAATSADEAIILQIKGINVLSFHKGGDGIAIIAKLFGPDGKLAAEVVDNQLYLNPGGAFKVEIADHSFTVYDQDKKKVLNIVYLNPHSMRVTGVFEAPGASEFVVSDGDLFTSGIRFHEGCFIDNGILFRIP